MNKCILLPRFPDRPLVDLQATLGSVWLMVGFNGCDGLGCHFGYISLPDDGLGKGGGKSDGTLGG